MAQGGTLWLRAPQVGGSPSGFARGVEFFTQDTRDTCVTTCVICVFLRGTSSVIIPAGGERCPPLRLGGLWDLRSE